MRKSLEESPTGHLILLWVSLVSLAAWTKKEGKTEGRNCQGSNL